MRLLIQKEILFELPDDECAQGYIDKMVIQLKLRSVRCSVTRKTGWIYLVIFAQKITLDEVAMNTLLQDVFWQMFDFGIIWIPGGIGCDFSIELTNTTQY